MQSRGGITCPGGSNRGARQASTEAIWGGTSGVARAKWQLLPALMGRKQANRNAAQAPPTFEKGESGCLPDRFAGIQFVSGEKEQLLPL